MDPAHRQAAVHALQTDGFVVLEDVIEKAHVEALREKMLADVEVIMARPQPPFQFIPGHIQHDPPPFPPFLFRDVLMNDMVVDLTKSILGPGLINDFYSGNTNLPGSGTQPVHPDEGQLWANLEAAPPAHAFVVNVPVVDMDEINGSTELWPGTHRDVTMHIHLNTLRVPEERLRARRAVVPPIQPRVKAGSILIRDLRLWHRGMPNRSDRPRPMIAMIYRCQWWGSPARIPFPKGTESFFKDSDLTTSAVFVDGPIDYLSRHTTYDFQSS
jgi:ectoine hydroxylase-related dioxygenase (phytanoyl-CoA dioxygenase family)